MPQPAPPTDWSGWVRVPAYGLLLVLVVELAVWGAFLVPFRLGGTIVPVSWLVALLGNAAAGYAGGRLAGKLGAVIPGVVWLALALTFGSRRAEGDLVVTGSTTGTVFLLVGALSSAVAYAVVVTRTAPGTSRA